jgi:Kef-type K+ transport system membrane component KefB
VYPSKALDSVLQVEADIRPFRGLLLGLFFVTTGGSIDMEVRSNYLTCIARPRFAVF